jgi:hypothetical protein
VTCEPAFRLHRRAPTTDVNSRRSASQPGRPTATAAPQTADLCQGFGEFSREIPAAHEKPVGIGSGRSGAAHYGVAVTEGDSPTEFSGSLRSRARCSAERSLRAAHRQPGHKRRMPVCRSACGQALGMLEVGDGPPWPMACRRSLLTVAAGDCALASPRRFPRCRRSARFADPRRARATSRAPPRPLQTAR